MVDPAYNHYTNPDAATLMPLKAILSFSGSGANSERRRLVHVAALDQLPQIFGEIHHAFQIADANGVAQFQVFPFGNQLLDDRVDDHDLVRRHAGLLEPFEQFLADDGLEVVRERLADGAVLVRAGTGREYG